MKLLPKPFTKVIVFSLFLSSIFYVNYSVEASEISFNNIFDNQLPLSIKTDNGKTYNISSSCNSSTKCYAVVKKPNLNKVNLNEDSHFTLVKYNKNTRLLYFHFTSIKNNGKEYHDFIYNMQSKILLGDNSLGKTPGDPTNKVTKDFINKLGPALKQKLEELNKY